jgi:hypothetical protein
LEAFLKLVCPENDFNYYVTDRIVDFTEDELEIIEQRVNEIDVRTQDGHEKFECLVIEVMSGIGTPISQEVIAKIIELEPQMEAVVQELKRTYSPDALSELLKGRDARLGGPVLMKMLELKQEKKRLRRERIIMGGIAIICFTIFVLHSYFAIV